MKKDTYTAEQILKAAEMGEVSMIDARYIVKILKEGVKQVKVEDFVKKWIEGAEPDIFVKNKYGNLIYSSGPSSINLTYYFEELLRDYIEKTE